MKNKKLGFGIILVLLFVMAFGMTSLAAGNTKTMKNKKWVSGKGGEYIDTDKDGTADEYKSNGKVFYKIQIPKQGYIMVEAQVSELTGGAGFDDDDYEDDEGMTDFTLLNSSKKKSLQAGDSSIEKKIKFSYAVKKGTYYLAVEGNQAYKIRYTFTAVAKLTKTGKSLKKPVTLKKGVTAKNLIVSTEKDHYYKINLSKKTKMNISAMSKMTGGTPSGMLVALYAKKGNQYKLITEKGKLVKKGGLYFWTYDDDKGTIKATLPKGTYCIRVGSFGSSTGYYTLKWK